MINYKSQIDWVQSGNTWSQTNRQQQTYIQTEDLYFRYNRYLSGVSFLHTNQLDNIYEYNVHTGDNGSNYNLYTPDAVINEFMFNLQYVDTAHSSNININSSYYELGGVQLRFGHRILLTGQYNLNENGIYVYGENQLLKKSTDLSTYDKSFRYRCYVKAGDYFDTQYYLVPSGTTFPIDGSPIVFTTGHSYIIKHIIDYDVNNESVDASIFLTDIDVARRMTKMNYEYYSDVTITGITTSTFYINYRDDVFTITPTSNTYHTYSSTYISGETLENYSGHTQIKTTSTFLDTEYVNIVITSGTTTLLIFSTYVENKEVSFPFRLTLHELIPDYVIKSLNDTATNYSIYSVSYTGNTSTQLSNAINMSPYGKFITATYSGSDITLTPKYNSDNIYFDYCDLSFTSKYVTGLTFPCNNPYIKYKIQPFLANIEPTVFAYNCPILPTYSLTSFTSSYTNDYITIIASNSSETYNFAPYTFVKLTGNTYSASTLIESINGNTMKLLRPSNPVTGSTYTIDRVFRLGEISDSVQGIYNANIGDNVKKNVYSGYAEYFSLIQLITGSTTGILSTGRYGFILRLYDLIFDPKLNYYPVELLDIGVDKRTKMPEPLVFQTESRYITLPELDGGYNIEDGIRYYGSYTDLSSTFECGDAFSTSYLTNPNGVLLTEVYDGSINYSYLIIGH